MTMQIPKKHSWDPKDDWPKEKVQALLNLDLCLAHKCLFLLIPVTPFLPVRLSYHMAFYTPSVGPVEFAW
jgi:hypothetical protein